MSLTATVSCLHFVGSKIHYPPPTSPCLTPAPSPCSLPHLPCPSPTSPLPPPPFPPPRLPLPLPLLHPCPLPLPPPPPHPCPATSAPSLRFAAALAQDLGHPVPNQWLVVADKIKVPFDPKLNFHPEFDGYRPGEWTRSPFKALLSSHRTLCPPGHPVSH